MPEFTDQLTTQERQVLEWIRSRASPLAPAFEGALRLIYDPTFPGRLHLIAHAIRDINSRLSDVLYAEEEGHRVSYEDHLDKISKTWPLLETLQEGDHSIAAGDTVPIDRKTFMLINDAVETHRNRRTRRDRLGLLFHYLLRETQASKSVIARILSTFDPLDRWFRSAAHFPNKPAQIPDSELSKRFGQYVGMLHSFVGEFFVGTRAIDELLQGDDPTKLQENLHLISSPQHEAYFFRMLENPAWIEAMHACGLFSHPPQKINVAGSTHYPYWQASQFLTRMASQAPEVVTRIFVGMDIDNPTVVGNLLDAATSMPLDCANQLVPKICIALKNGIKRFDLDAAHKLCLRFAEEGQLSVAFKLADELFTTTKRTDRHRDHIEDYWYEKGIELIMHVLLRNAPSKFIKRLCRWVKQLVYRHHRVNAESFSDGSYYWRPAIEEHEQNSDYDLTSKMVGHLRHCLEESIRAESITLQEGLALVEEQRLLVFQRLRLHLINVFAERVPELAQEAMLSFDRYTTYEYQHEYAMLVGQRFDLLSPEQKDQWFGWLESNPRYGLSVDELNATEQQVRYREQRELGKLFWIRNHLQGTWLRRFEELHAKYGEPESSDMITTSYIGSQSPYSLEELSGLSFSEVLSTIAQWRPRPNGFGEPSHEGFARVFEEYVASNATSVSGNAADLKTMEPTYIRHFLRAITESLKAGRQIDIFAVFELCDWVVERPPHERSPINIDSSEPVDKDWEWTRTQIADFVDSICRAKQNDARTYPCQCYRERIWRLLDNLHRSTVGQDEDQRSVDPRLQDYLQPAINSTRGRAVETALNYAAWVIEQQNGYTSELERPEGWFSVIPEIREMLEWHLLPENQTEYAFAIIGHRVGQVYSFDREWLPENSSRIMNLTVNDGEPREHVGWAAWNAFLIWCPPHSRYYAMFREQYAFAVAQSTTIELADDDRNCAFNRLGEHLMLLYARGLLSLHSPEETFRTFLGRRHPQIRRHSFGFIGRVLGREETVDNVVNERLQVLWDHYWNDSGKNDAAEQPDSQLFGTWFISGKFDPQWSLDRLEQFTEVAPCPQPDYEVVKRLSHLAASAPDQTFRIIGTMIKCRAEHGGNSSWIRDSRPVFQAALAASPATRQEARALIDSLGRRGFLDFRDLLDDYSN